MTTITRIAKDAQFFTNASNARRALKKLFACDTAVANTLLHTEAYEDGGRTWFSPAAVTAAANSVANATVETDKATVIEVPAAPAVTTVVQAPKASKARSVTQNGVRRPIKGLCATIWAELDARHERGDAIPTVKQFREDMRVVLHDDYNENNVTIEFYGWRKFHGLNKAAK